MNSSLLLSREVRISTHGNSRPVVARFQPCAFVLFLLAISLTIAGCQGVPTGLGRPDAFPTRDVEPVTVACTPITFIVSLNDDDDNANRREDRNDPIAPATEDNLREFIFTHPDADAVFISHIVTTADNQNAVGIRVRGYQADRSTAFVYNTTHPTSAAAPLKMYLEGIKTSGALNDIGFEYQYFKNNLPLCGGGAQGTVVDVNAKLVVASGAGASFKSHRKMLITAAGQANGTVTPANAGQTEWTYDIPANINLSAPAQLATNITAQTTVTDAAHLDQDQLHLKVHATAHRIEAHFPINLTSPQHTEITNGVTGFDHTTGWLDANVGQFTLVPTRRINYRLLDQFRRPIKESAYDTRMPQIRENIGLVLTSPVPAVQNWINTGLRWSPNWINKADGTFTDRIEATNLNKDLVVVVAPGNRRMFHAVLQNQGGVLMNLTSPHIWHR